MKLLLSAGIFFARRCRLDGCFPPFSEAKMFVLVLLLPRCPKDKDLMRGIGECHTFACLLAVIVAAMSITVVGYRTAATYVVCNPGNA